MNMLCVILLMAAGVLAQNAQGQFSVIPQASPAPPLVVTEQDELRNALAEASTSPMDLIRVLEAHLKKYPNSPQRGEIDRVLAKAAIDLKDDARTILYGERVLAAAPDDMLVLDRVARALLVQGGGAPAAEKAFRYAHMFEEIVDKLPTAEGTKDAGRRQEERDRGIARSLLYQARAKTILGLNEESEQLAAHAFATYPDAEGAREWSTALARLGRNDEALTRMAEAFAIPDSRVSDQDRTGDRRKLGELYVKAHGSEKGLGDLILAAYDRESVVLEARRKRLLSLDPNAAATDPIDFTLTSVDGSKLPLGMLKGNIVVMDFWATWCKPCQAQHPMYEEVKQRFRGRNDVKFLSIDADEDRTLVSPFLDESKWSRNAVYFEDGLQRLLDVSAIPTTILFDKQGRVSSRMNGFIPDHFVDQLTERILQALQDSAK